MRWDEDAPIKYIHCCEYTSAVGSQVEEKAVVGFIGMDCLNSSKVVSYQEMTGWPILVGRRYE